MDEEIKKKMLSYIEVMEGVVKQGTDFELDQTPLALHEFVAYSRVYSTCYVCVGLLAVAAGLFFASRAFKKESWPDHQEVPCGVAYVVLAAILLVMAAPCILKGNFDTAVKSWVAPRVLILDKLNEMRK